MNQSPDSYTPGNDTPANETQPTENKGLRLLSGIFDYIELIAISVAFVLIVFTFCFRLCHVDGSSMNQTLIHGEYLIASDLFYEPEGGDIVVFHVARESYNNSLVKRVIATEGQSVVIDITDKTLTVDGVLIEETYRYLDIGEYNRSYFSRKYLTVADNGNYIYSLKVPEGKLFVMGDNRNHSMDSRSDTIGFVDKECILGKAIIRVSPFTIFN